MIEWELETVISKSMVLLCFYFSYLEKIALTCTTGFLDVEGRCLYNKDPLLICTLLH